MLRLRLSFRTHLEGIPIMLEGVSITCFASSYFVAFILEISRLVFRSGIRGVVLLGFAGAGLFAHTVFLVHRALQSTGAPLSSQQDWYLLSAWVLVAGYLGLTCRQRKNVLGLFLLPLVLMLVGAAAWFADATPFAREPAVQLWGLVHGVSILLATIAVLAGFILGLMYVFQAYLLKRSAPCRAACGCPAWSGCNETTAERSPSRRR